MQKGLKKYFVNMDEYLTSLGFYRKMVARDASSLFRAVSEQVSRPEGQHDRSVGTKELGREVCEILETSKFAGSQMSVFVLIRAKNFSAPFIALTNLSIQRGSLGIAKVKLAKKKVNFVLVSPFFFYLPSGAAVSSSSPPPSRVL